MDLESLKRIYGDQIEKAKKLNLADIQKEYGIWNIGNIFNCLIYGSMYVRKAEKNPMEEIHGNLYTLTPFGWMRSSMNKRISELELQEKSKENLNFFLNFEPDRIEKEKFAKGVSYTPEEIVPKFIDSLLQKDKLAFIRLLIQVDTELKALRRAAGTPSPNRVNLIVLQIENTRR